MWPFNSQHKQGSKSNRGSMLVIHVIAWKFYQGFIGVKGIEWKIVMGQVVDRSK